MGRVGAHPLALLDRTIKGTDGSCRPREPPEALPSPILRGRSRPRQAALRFAPVRVGGAVAPRWRRGNRRGRGVAGGGGAGGSRGCAPQHRYKKGLLEFLSAHRAPARSPVQPRSFPRHAADKLGVALHAEQHLGSLLLRALRSAGQSRRHRQPRRGQGVDRNFKACFPRCRPATRAMPWPRCALAGAGRLRVRRWECRSAHACGPS